MVFQQRKQISDRILRQHIFLLSVLEQLNYIHNMKHNEKQYNNNGLNIALFFLIKKKSVRIIRL